MAGQIQISKRWIITALWIMVAAGCAAPSRNSSLTTIEDRTAYAPQFRGYNGPGTSAVPQQTPTVRVEKPTMSEPPLTEPTLDGTEFEEFAETEETEDVILPEPDPRIAPYREYPNVEAGPLLAPAPLITPPTEGNDTDNAAQPVRLLLEIVRPERATLDGDVRFDVTIRNETNRDAEDIDVYCTFEQGLQFPGKEETELRRNIGSIAAGESQTMSLTLIAKQLGRHCAQFTIKSGGTEVVWKSVCTDVTKQAMSLEIIGPDRRNVGSRAEHTMTIVNVSDTVLHGVQAELTFDDALVPKEATEGAVEGEDSLSWNLGDLQPGEVLQLQVEFECERAAEVAKFDVKLTAAGGSTLRRETGLQIVPGRGLLDLRIQDQAEPIAVDDEVVYLVTVQNRGFQDVRNVQVGLTPPTGIKILDVSIKLNDEPLELPHKVQRGTWDYETMRQLPADSTLQFQIRAQGVRAGNHKFVAAVKSDLDSKPHTIEEWTTINAQ
ncbi:Large cysteine-rich periplasmic protein OmcB precursor [Symmachiella dynata]|uniref:Large cysteine-rich periplasmic protein OmcB n=1 Tax=Symmachiella dynata TaxID=2527995 RepID=A0A517ZYM9_9PLAN|nr:DUF11 domain-containing protein [Symmachiella dynata]QDU47550.1 Large cysteine-rich periplasmic protein OmcB precursor [Symmachiella dynata]